ncbi:MAG: hypothetical protein TRG1_938 [Flavobacteriaceae bacterium FS1-H7996/R]|nr:MAG: hypothetical protein TRG1_938 [Flavobacteriaceae bacterium FS1-H7996/R]
MVSNKMKAAFLIALIKNLQVFETSGVWLIKFILFILKLN